MFLCGCFGISFLVILSKVSGNTKSADRPVVNVKPDGSTGLDADANFGPAAYARRAPVSLALVIQEIFCPYPPLYCIRQIADEYWEHPPD